MKRCVLATAVFAGLLACSKCDRQPEAPAPPPAARPDPAAELAPHRCEQPQLVYRGSITVDASDYMNLVPKGDDYVDAPIEGLDRVVSTQAQLRFVLDYPFEKPFNGTVSAPLTLRRIIDAIRAGFRTMYGGATVKDIPGMMNKDVKGAYGSSFHAIGDLVIEHIDLCADGTLDIGIGS